MPKLIGKAVAELLVVMRLNSDSVGKENLEATNAFVTAIPKIVVMSRNQQSKVSSDPQG